MEPSESKGSSGGTLGTAGGGDQVSVRQSASDSTTKRSDTGRSEVSGAKRSASDEDRSTSETNKRSASETKWLASDVERSASETKRSESDTKRSESETKRSEVDAKRSAGGASGSGGGDGMSRTGSRASRASLSKTLSSADTFMDAVPEALPPETLENTIQLLNHANLLLKLENDVFEEKLSRHNPDLLAGAYQMMEAAAGAAECGPGGGGPLGAARSSSTQADVLDIPSRSKTRGSASTSDLTSPRNTPLKSKTNSLDKAPKMGLSQRAELVEEVTRIIRERRGEVQAAAASTASSLSAQIEEMSARQHETRLAVHQLMQLDAGMARTAAEKFVRFMTDLIKGSEAAVERLRLKTSSLRAHHRRVKVDLAVKRELGEALHPVDFDKIRIEIREMGKKIESKNKHLIDLKNISGGATARLLGGKKRLLDLTRQLEEIRREAASKQAQIASLEGEEHEVLDDVARADVALNAIRLRLERHSAPDVLHYVRMKDELDTLRKDVVVWDRRCKIQQQTERDLKRGLKLITSGPTGPGSRAARERGGSASSTSTSVSSVSSARSAVRRRSRRRRRLRSSSRSRSRSAGTPGTASTGTGSVTGSAASTATTSS